MHLSLRDYQKTSIQYAVDNPYCILALDMGLGKTLCALVASERTGSKLLVICPAYLVFNWLDEIKKFFPEKIVSAFTSSKQIYLPWDTEICLVSYGIVAEAEILFEWADMVVLDEAHYVKNMKAKRTEVIHKFIFENSVRRVILLTGTPIENAVWELYSLLCICNYDPRIKESVFLNKFLTHEDFADEFSFRKERVISTKRGVRRVATWEGKKNIRELKEKYLINHFIRFKADDCLDLPDSIYYDIMIDEIEDSELLEAFKEFNAENDTVGPEIKAEVALKKAPFTVNYVKDLLESGIDKIVVYTDHVGACEFMAEKLKTTAIHGGTSMEARKNAAYRFINGDDKVIVATIGSFSTGITLTRARDMVFNDYPWVPGRLAQAEARIKRIGQKFVCRFHRILGSIQDRYILNRISEKREVITEVIDEA